jgi:hypothetical protein
MGPLTVEGIDIPFHLSLYSTSRHEIAQVNRDSVDNNMERWLAESRLWMAAPNRTFVINNSR